jgi:hypothetical protein
MLNPTFTVLRDVTRRCRNRLTMTATLPSQSLSPTQLTIIQTPQQRNLPAPSAPQPASARPAPATSAASVRGRIVDIVV